MEDMYIWMNKMYCAKRKQALTSILSDAGWLFASRLSTFCFSLVKCFSFSSKSLINLWLKKKHGHAYVCMWISVSVWLLVAVLPSSFPASEVCRHRCYCCPSQTSVPPLLYHLPTWALEWSQRWCSEARVTERHGQTTFSAKNGGKHIYLASWRLFPEYRLILRNPIDYYTHSTVLWKSICTRSQLFQFSIQKRNRKQPKIQHQLFLSAYLINK